MYPAQIGKILRLKNRISDCARLLGNEYEHFLFDLESSDFSPCGVEINFQKFKRTPSP